LPDRANSACVPCARLERIRPSTLAARLCSVRNAMLGRFHATRAPRPVPRARWANFRALLVSLCARCVRLARIRMRLDRVSARIALPARRRLDLAGSTAVLVPPGLIRLHRLPLAFLVVLVRPIPSADKHRV
jgi:hypothetical protein